MIYTEQEGLSLAKTIADAITKFSYSRDCTCDDEWGASSECWYYLSPEEQKEEFKSWLFDYLDNSGLLEEIL